MNKTKQQMLRDAGFSRPANRDVFVNQRTRKVVSEEAILDRSEAWLTSAIADVNDSGAWKFYFEEPPSDATVQSLIAELDA